MRIRYRCRICHLEVDLPDFAKATDEAQRGAWVMACPDHPDSIVDSCIEPDQKPQDQRQG